MQKQVNIEHYYFDYDTKKRFASYWHQIDELLKVEHNSVLEIGKGNGFYSTYIKNLGINISTLDYAKDLNPDIVASVLDMPYNDNSHETVVCFQMLEHLPYEKFSKALTEISRVASKNVIISLPQAKMGWYYAIHIPYFGRKEFMLEIPSFPKKHKFDGQHYWEIGKRDYPLKRILDEFQKVKLDLINTYRVTQNPYHRFFILKKN